MERMVVGAAAASSLRLLRAPRHCLPRHQTRFAGRRTLARAESDQNDRGSPTSPPIRLVGLSFISVLGFLGVADAGFSGDWSRIGVLTPEQEDVLKLVFLAQVLERAFLAATQKRWSAAIMGLPSLLLH